MDEFEEAAIAILALPGRQHEGPTAVLKTRGGDEYHVWIGPDGLPLIQKMPRY